MKRLRSGFTLVELLVYVGVFSVAAGLFTGVLTTLTRVQVRESATVEVSQQAQFVVQTVQRLIRDASIVELPANTAVSKLKLRLSSASLDPTCVEFSNGIAYLMEGNDGVNKQNCFATSTSQAKALTDSKVVVNTLNFTKLSNPPAKDTVQIDITVSFNSANPQESSISRTLRSAITKVSAATFDADIVPVTDNVHSVGIGAQRWLDGFFSRNLTVGNNLTVDTNTLFVDAVNNNVGIGTVSPIVGSKVHIFAGGAGGVGWSTGLNIGDATNYTGLIQDTGVSRWRNFGTGGYDWYSSGALQRMALSDAGVLTVDGGTGKINAGTIDPLYNIGGTRYATYLPGMTGTVREEAVGTVTLRSREAVVDFDELTRGDALWVFYQVTDFGPRWDNLVVQLTPNTNGTVWYEKDVLRNRLIIKGEKGGEVSYRLSAPRFDHEKWDNVSDTQTGGFEVKEKQ